MTSKIAVMIDLETLGTGPDATIIQIAAIPFDPSPDGTIYVDEALSVFVDPASQPGRSVTASTLKWWLELPPEAQERMAKGLERATDLKTALANLDNLIWAFHMQKGYCNEARNWGDVAEVWANGTTFDITLLQTAYTSLDQDPPWASGGGFRKVRDQRTLLGVLSETERYKVTELTNFWANGLPIELVPHDGVDDCIYQCKLVQNANHRIQYALKQAYPE